MKQIPGYNLHVIQKSEITSAQLDHSPGVLWYPNELGGWYVCREGTGGVILLSGPHGDEREALVAAYAMTDTSGT